MNAVSRLCLLAASTALLAAPAAAQVGPAPISKTHSATVAGKTFGYTAAFERFDVAGPGSKPGGTITTISYVRDGIAADRPVVFAFNGGPGSNSIYLNVGLLGPRRVELPTDPKAPLPARAPYVANDDSILDVADIVLIDPVGTGYSQLTDPAARSYFYSVLGDGQSVADVIAAWSAKHGRQDARKYVFGESYGAVRAVTVGNALTRMGVTKLEGVVLLSQSLPVLDTVQRRSNTVGQVVGMPTIAATAWYHKLAGQGRTLEDFTAEAADFARREWLPALVAGTALPAAERQAVARKLSSFTGVPADWLLAHDLYLSKEDYRRVALGGRNLILGLYDTRYTGPLPGERNPDNAITGAISATAEDMFQTQFGVSAAGYLEPRPDRPRGDWIYVKQPFATTAGETYLQLDYAAELMRLMKAQPKLKILLAGGWYDTAASAGADDYLMSRPGLDVSRISARHYVGGHMFYTDPVSRRDFAQSVRRFLVR